MTQAPATPELVERLNEMASMPHVRFHYRDDVVMVKQAASALEAQQARIAELEAVLTVTNLNLGLATAQAESSQALADRFETALRDLIEHFEGDQEHDEGAFDEGCPDCLALQFARQALSSQGRHEGGEEPAGVYRGWKGVTQPCDVCGKSVAVNAVSPSECHCSEACGLIAYGLDKPSPDNTNPKAGAPEHG